MRVNVELGPALADPKARLSVRHRMRVAAVEKPVPMPVTELVAEVDAAADLGAQTASLDRLSVRLNGEPVLALAAAVKDFERPSFEATVEHARAPLAALLPFVRPLLPPEVQLELAGEAGIEALSVRGSLAEIQAGTLPPVTGRLFANGVRARVDTGPEGASGGALGLTLPALAVDVAGIETALAFGVDPASADAPLTLDGRFELRRLAAFGATVAGLDVKLAVGAALDGTAPRSAKLHTEVALARVEGFGATVDGISTTLDASVGFVAGAPEVATLAVEVAVPGLTYAVPGMGPVQLGDIAGAVTARANIPAGDVELERLEGRLGTLLAASATASVTDQGREALRVDAKLERLDIGGLLRAAPPGLRRTLPKGLRAQGLLSGTLHVEGKRPTEAQIAGLSGSPLAALRLPVDVRLQGRMHGVGARLPGVELAGLTGSVGVRVARGALQVSAPKPLRIARVAAAGAELTKLEIPLSLNFTPRALRFEGGMRAAGVSVLQGEQRIEASGLAAQLQADVEAPFGRALAGRRFDLAAIALDGELGLAKVDLRKPGLHAVATDFSQKMALGVVRDAPISVELHTRLGHAALPERKLEVRDLALTQTLAITGVHAVGLSIRAPIPRSADVKPGGLNVRYSGGLRPYADKRGLRIRAPGIPQGGWLTGNALDFDLEIDLPQLRVPPLDPDLFAEASVRMHRFELRNRSHGPVVVAGGTIGPLVYPSTAVPPFDLHARSGFAMPAGGLAVLQTGSAAGHDLLAARIDGEAWVGSRLRHLRDGVLEVETRLHAKDLEVHLEKHQHQETLPDGTQVFLARAVHLKDLDADVPIVQRVDLVKARQLATDPAALRAVLADVELLQPAARQIRGRGRSPAYGALRFASAPPNVTAARVDIDQRFTYFRLGEQVDQVDVPLHLERLETDVRYTDWVLDVRRFAVHALGGDIEGRFATQVKSAQPPNADVALQLGVTGLDISRLDPRKKSEPAPITFTTELEVGLADRRVDGVTHVSKLSLAQLDALFAFVDPARRNDLIQEQRKLINSYTVREWAAPTVKYVSLDIKHSSLDLETAFGGAWGVRHVLNRVVSAFKVENIDMREIIDNVLNDRRARLAWRTPPPLGAAPEAPPK